MDELHNLYGLSVTLDNREAAAKADVVVLCVKPQILGKVLSEIGECISEDALVIALPRASPWLRSEPIFRQKRVSVAPCRICHRWLVPGAAALVCGELITEDDKQMAHELFESCGLAVELRRGTSRCRHRTFGKRARLRFYDHRSAFGCGG